MSFTSSVTHESPARERLHSSSISDTFAVLGFKPAKTHTYEWMTAYPDAQELLHAIKSSFKPSSVLSECESNEYESFIASRRAIPQQYVFLASDPHLRTSPFFLNEEHNNVFQSAKNRLKFLEEQREVLRDAVDEEQSQAVSPAEIPSLRPSRTRERFIRFRSMLQTLHQQSRDIAGSSSPYSELLRHHDKELAQMKCLADSSAHLCPAPIKEAQALQDCAHRLVKNAVASYTQARSKQISLEALLARDTAMLAALCLNDVTYLEMTAASMTSQIKDLRTRGEDLLQKKISSLSSADEEMLWNRIEALSLNDGIQRCQTYAKSMEACIEALVAQRFRTSCFHSAAEFQERLKEYLHACIQGLTPSLSPVKDSDDASGLHIDEISPRNTACRSSSTVFGRLEIINCTSNGQKQRDLSFLDALQATIFSSAVEDSSTMIKDLKEKVGSSEKSLELCPHPKFVKLIEDLEQTVESNTVLLDALLRKRDSIVSGSRDPPQSPNKSWIRRINARSR